MKQLLIILISSLLFGVSIYAQSPGLIVRPAGGNGITPLNPNGDGFTSASANGFSSNDVTESEIPYKAIPVPIMEPTADLLRGPSHFYSDLVRGADNTGFYLYNDGTNLLFRLRLGNLIAGSKGYSVLIDTDGKFGSTGAYADPNYQPATTGINGNPGFELEVVLETNFRVAVYNVDGTSNPTLLASYSLNTNSQISVALSTVSNSRDYFYDFYVPISVLGITASTPLRLVATTVMAPMAAIGGPKSDIYGVDDAACKNSMTCWETAVTNQCSFSLNNINSSGSGPCVICTAAPAVTSPIQAGSNITISGTWSRFDATKPSTATITLYKNGVSIGTTTATTGVAWNITGVTVSAGDILYADAQATGESKCLQSANVKVTSCSPANSTTNTGLTFTCFEVKGFEGTRPSGTSVKLYQVTAAGVTLYGDDNSTTYLISYPTATTWRYDGQYGLGAQSACTGGNNDIAEGTYMVTATQSGKCESIGVYTCVATNIVTTATPVITQTTLTSGSSLVSGTATAGATVRLYRNGRLENTTTATGGNFSFTGLALAIGDVVSVYAVATTSCQSAAATLTVNCYTTPPTINTDNNGNLSTTAATISGKSTEPTGTVVTILENSVSIGTTTVQSDGTWSFTYTPVASRSYTATQQNGTCSVSTTSAAAVALAATTVCPTISGTYQNTASTVSGTLPSSFSGTIRLYEDGILIGSVAVTNATTWSIPVNTTYSNVLYPSGVLTCTSQATSGAEKTDCPSTTTVTCPTLSSPAFSPTSTNVYTGQPVTFTVTGTTSGIIYSVTDNTLGLTNYATSKFGNSGSLSLPTYNFNSIGTYNLKVNAVSLAGPGCISSGAAVVTVTAQTLPVKLLYFTGKYENNQSHLLWATSTEQNTDHFSVERSDDGVHFKSIGIVAAAGNSSGTLQYAFTDQQAIGNTAWYRLQMVDKDGRFTTSQVLRLSKSGNKGLAVLSVLPNPFENDILLQVQSDKAQSISIQLMDITGREVFRTSKAVNAGNSNVTVSSLSHLPKGLYVLRVTNNKEELATKRINKVR